MRETNNRPKAGGLMSSPPFYLDFRGRFNFKKLEQWTQADSGDSKSNGIQRAELYRQNGLVLSDNQPQDG